MNKNKLELLNRKEKLNHEYWILKIKSEEQYRKYKLMLNKYASMRAKVKKMEREMMEIIREYQE